MFKKQEQGRSMVEMLGVLAVMGVLSVGGVAMYTSAMNKHRANELLNEASKRAAVVAGQLLIRDKGNLSEFTNNTVAGATFGTGEITPTNGQFEIKFAEGKKPDATICAQMKAAAGDNSAMTIAEDCSSITFKSDLSKGSSTAFVPTVEEDETDLTSCTADHSGYDDRLDYTGDYTNQVLSSGHRCMCDNYYPVWNGTACVAASTTKVCNSSTPCGSGEYCRYNGVSGLTCYSDANGNPVTGNGSTTEVNGTCEKVSGVKKTTDGKFYYSTSTMDWFSAKSWCEGIGMDLVTGEIAGQALNSSFENFDKGPLYPYFGQDISFWTGHVKDSCRAWYVLASSDYDYVSNYPRTNHYSPMCE